MAKEVKTITYLIRRKNQDMQVTVPAAWKVTFGNIQPGSKTHSPSGEQCLRFYEAKDKQRMVITQVESFRDMSIPVMERRTSVKQQTMYKDTEHGKKNVIVEGRVSEWVNPDKPEADKAAPEFMRLGHSLEESME